MVNNMEKDTSFLEQMVKSMEDLEPSLERYYKAGDVEKFNKTKKTMVEIQEKIAEVLNAE
ncbi:hypothetical protein HYT25_02360 [Candidatus Pacearchaeota archaeon]|nr:hypothetical protein [Candidatus Pacearchaeota archaeon]